jgi:hypothetical protein
LFTSSCATHPNELREHGEAYLLAFEILAKKNKLEKNVIFYNQFVELENLKEFIGAADLTLRPTSTRRRLRLAHWPHICAGKAVVSTPYWYAAELLAEERGFCAIWRCSAIAREVLFVARRHPPACHSQERLQNGREMIWSNVAQLYMRSFELSRLEATANFESLWPRNTGPKAARTAGAEAESSPADDRFDRTFQHAIFSIPNFSEGYCTDDNARYLSWGVAR